MYRPCTNKYILCTAHVQLCIFISKFIVLGIFNVYIQTHCFSTPVCHGLHAFLELEHAMYIPGTYIKCTKTYFLVHVLESKNLQEGRIELRISSRVYSSLSHCASSVDTTEFTVIIYVYCFTWRLVTYVQRRTSSPIRPRHDVVGLSLHMDLFKPRPAAKHWQGWEERMWRRILARWRKSQGLERWPVAVHCVQLTPCSDRLTGFAPDSRIGWPGPVARPPACWSQ